MSSSENWKYLSICFSSYLEITYCIHNCTVALKCFNSLLPNNVWTAQLVFVLQRKTCGECKAPPVHPPSTFIAIKTNKKKDFANWKLQFHRRNLEWRHMRVGVTTSGMETYILKNIIDTIGGYGFQVVTRISRVGVGKQTSFSHYIWTAKDEGAGKSIKLIRHGYYAKHFSKN